MRLNRIEILIWLAAAVLVSACQDDMKLQYAKGDGVEADEPMPPAPQGDQKRFSLQTEDGALRTIIGTGAHQFSSEDRIYLRSEYYEPSVAEDGSGYLDVSSAASGSYNLFCFPKGSKYWFRSADNNPLENLVIPYSQFYRSTVDSLRYYPLYGKYNEGEGGGLVFKEVISAVGITVRGDAKIASVHLQNKASSDLVSDNLAGVASFEPDNGYVLKEGVNFVNLNCTDGGKGVTVTPGGKTFFMVVSPGNYASGLTLTLTDMDHKGQTFDIDGFEISAGQVKTVEVTYSPDPDLLFFEHFDNFVWGGNVKGNKYASSYAPDNLSSPGADRSGYEEAFTTVGVTTPGSSVIQANWSTVNGWSVAERPSVSQSYILSRNIGDYAYLYRCQEYQGCISVGAGDELRGGIQPSKDFYKKEIAHRLDGEAFYGLKLSYDICLRYGTEDMFCSQLSESGIASKLVVDGNEIALENTLEGNNTYAYTFMNVCAIRRSDIPAPTSERYTDGWHHVEMTFNNLNELSKLGLWGFDSSNNIKHGGFVDNIEIHFVPVEHPASQLRVLLYNIQNGMWADQGNNFDNLVAFVRKLDPDVCIFCEGQSLWKTGSAEYAGKSSYQLFTNQTGLSSNATANTTDKLENAQWKDLAARFGHSYHAVSMYRDPYPQVITSKYPVNTVLRIARANDKDGRGTTLIHGAGHYQVTAGGQTVNFVSLHLWPMKYGPSEADTEENREKLHGYDYARREVEALLGATVKRTDCGENWLIMGDTNSISPLDDEYYGDVAFTRWDTEGYKWVQPHQAFLSGDYGRPLYDMLRQGDGSLYTGPGRFMTSTGGIARMDIMYGSESMKRRVSSLSLMLNDSFSGITTSAVYDPESDEKHPKVPSDHRPLLIEFDMSK